MSYKFDANLWDHFLGVCLTITNTDVFHVSIKEKEMCRQSTIERTCVPIRLLTQR